MESRQINDAAEVTFARESRGGRGILRVIGELKYKNSPELYSEAIEFFKQGIKELFIDLRQLVYLDSSALQSLIKIHRYTLDDPSVDFILLLDSSEISDIFETCCFNRFIKITMDASLLDKPWNSSLGTFNQT